MREVIPTCVQITLHCFLWCVCCCGIAFSQQSSTNLAEAYLQLPVGARAVGLAGAYTAIGNEPITVFYNPAGIAFLPDKPQLSLMVSPQEFGRVHSAFAYAQTINEQFGVGAGLIHYWNGSFTERDVLGTPLRELSSEQYAISVGGTWRTGDFAVGATGKYLINTLRGTGSKGTAFTMDLGAKADIADLFSVGIAAQNLFGAMNWNNTSVSERLPYSLRAGIATEFSLEKETYTVRKNVRGETETIELPSESYVMVTLDAVLTQYDHTPIVVLGAEYTPVRLFSVRGGFNVLGEEGGTTKAFPMTRWGGGISFTPPLRSLPFSFQIDYSIANDAVSSGGIDHMISLIVDI